jgi:hypothetical protein
VEVIRLHLPPSSTESHCVSALILVIAYIHLIFRF